MKRMKLWKRMLAALLSASMVVGNLPVTELVARAEESELLALDDSGGDVVLPEDEPAESDVFTEQPETDASSGSLEIEGIEELPGITEWLESESETESEYEKDFGADDANSEGASEAESAVEPETVESISPEPMTAEAETEPMTVEAEMPTIEAAPVETELAETVSSEEPDELITETQWESELLTEGMELLAVEDAEAGSGETAGDAAGETEPAAGETEPAAEGVAVLTSGTPAAVEIAQEGDVKWFSFTPDRTGTYCFRSTGRYDTLARLYADRDGDPLAEADDSGSQYNTDNNFVLSYALVAGQTYYLSVQMCYEYIVGSFEISVDWENYAVQSIQFTPKRTYYYPLDSYYSISYSNDVSADVVYTDGKQEHITGYSSYTGNSIYHSWDNNVSIANNFVKPGTWGMTASYIGESYPYEVKVLPVSEIPVFPESGTLEGSGQAMPWYRVTPAVSGYYSLFQKSATGTVESIVRVSGGTFINPIDNTGWSSAEGYFNDNLYWLEAGQDYFISVPYASNAALKWSLSVHLAESLPQEAAAEGNMETGGQYVYQAEQNGLLELELEASGSFGIEVYQIVSHTTGSMTHLTRLNGRQQEDGTWLASGEVNIAAGQEYLVVLDGYSGEYTIRSSFHQDASGIEIEQLPAKLSYVQGELLNPDGLSVRATYADGTSKTVAYAGNSSLKVAAADSAYFGESKALRAGTHTVTVSYSNCETEYTINVTEAEELSLTDGIPLSMTLPANSGYIEKYCTFVPVHQGFYTITLAGENVGYREISLYDSQGRQAVSETDGAFLVNGGERYAVSVEIGPSDEDKEMSVVLTAASAEQEVQALEAGGSYTVAGQQWFSFIPSDSGQYLIYSNSGAESVDTHVWLYTARDGLLAENDDEGADLNFRLSHRLEAGVTYYYKAGPHGGGSSSESFEVFFEKQSSAKSMKIISYPRQSFCTRIDQKISYRDFCVEVTYDDETSEKLDYNTISEITGSSVQIQEPLGLYDADGRLMAGTHTITATYMRLSVEYQVTVRSFEEFAAELKGDVEQTGKVSAGSKDYWRFTPTEDGDYRITVAEEDAYRSISVTDEDDSSVSRLDYSTNHVTVDGVDYVVVSSVYNLKAGNEYCISMSGGSEGASYRVMVSKVPELMLDGSIQSTGLGYQYAVFSVQEAGFYRMDLHADGDASYYGDVSITDHSSGYGSNNYGQSYYRYDSNNTVTVAYLEPGEYTVTYRPIGQPDILTFAKCGDSTTAVELPHTFDIGEATGTYWDARVVTPSESGSYVFKAKRRSSNYNYYYSKMYVLDQEMNQISGDVQSDRSSEEGENGYIYTMGADLAAGETYLFISMPNDLASLSAEKVSSVSAITLGTTPRTTYYYKLDKIRRNSGLASGSSLEVQYADGTEETLFDSSISLRTGYTYSISLPEDARYDSAGYLMPGTYYADVTYLNQKIKLPVTVKSSVEVPVLILDESGAGSYTGAAPAGNNDYNYVRFRAPEDGFYDLTLSVASEYSVYYNKILNAAYGSMDFDRKYESSSTRKLIHTSVYVKRGQSCYVAYSCDDEAAEITLSVSRAANQTIEALTCGVRAEAVSESSADAVWYSFTPEETGKYIISTQDAGTYTPDLELYASPDDANSLVSYWGTINGRNRRLSYSMTAGTTYYVKLSNYTGTLGLIVVKESRAKLLELVTEGEIYCSSLPGYIESSFEKLRFRITYEDGTQEEIPFGYSSSERYTSLQDKEMSYWDPDWEYDENGNIVDKEYTVRFTYDGTYVDVPVTARSIQHLESASAEFTTTIAAGKYSYYKFTPTTSGFYRFTANADAVCPSVDLFDPHMKLMSSDYSNSYSDNGRYQVKVYELTEGQEYCLRLGNGGTVEQSVTCSNEILSPATSIEITAKPQTVYYLGVDSQYSEDGLKVQVTYENKETEAIAAGNRSTITGLAVETKLSGNDEGNKYLGSTGTKTVNVTYMGESASYSINVLDSTDISEMTAAKPYTGTLASARDDVYVKYIADATGFYRVSLAGGDGLTPEISAVKNSSYADQAIRYGALTQQDGVSVKQCIVYMLAGKAYYLKGYLLQDGTRAAGSYTASVQQLEDLRDGVVMNTLAAGAVGLCQFTAKETGYYQFTLDTAADVTLGLFNSGYGALSTQTDTREDRKYYIVRLQAGAVYLAAITNGSVSEQDYMLHAGAKAEVTKLTIAQQPSRLTYYAHFEDSISGDGLVLHIEYADGKSEELAFGQRSTWGVRMLLDSSAVKKDAKYNFAAGTYQIDCCYLEQKASYTIDVVDLDVESAQALTAELLTEIEVPAGESVFCTFTPEKTQTYHFYSRGDTVVDGYIYETDGTLVARDIGGNGFSVTTELTGGRQYILRVNAPSAKEKVTAMIKLHDTSASVEVSSVTLSENELVFGEIGETKTLTATVKPEDAADRSVSWSSSNEAVATVSADGTVTSVASGTAEITVTTMDCGYTAKCRVIVDLEVPEITEAYPADQTVLGPTAQTLYVYAHDNIGVSSLEVSYKKSTDADSKTMTAAAEETDVTDTVITAELPLDGFANGDTVTVSLTVTDRGGRRSDTVTRTYTVDKAAPGLSDLAGAYNRTTLAVDLSWKGMMEQDISGYSIYRKVKDADDSTYKYLGFETGYVNKADYSYTDATVENRDAWYTYRVTTLDKRGNSQDYTVDVQTWLVDQAPVASLNCASMMMSGQSYPFDLTGSKDDGEITAITIDYGDESGTDQASTAAEAIFEHTYILANDETEKTYTVSVTVTDDSNLSTTLTKTIRVVNLNSVGMLTVHVVDTDGIPLAGAPVYFNMGEESQVITETDRQGVAEFRDVEGFYAVGTYVTGYLPYKTSVELKLGEPKELTITLEKKELVETSIETHRMTLDEIRDVEKKMGISLTGDPDNYHVVRYMVTLEYSTTINIYSDGVNVFVDGGSESEEWIPVAVNDEIIVILKIPVGVSMLKEFYNVKMYIVNNASKEFSLLQNHVTLHVPEGLTVMEEAANGTEVDIDAIPGQTTEIVEWILRGDKSGKYDLSADYTGILSDFNAPLSATCKTDKQIEVYGVDNLGVSMKIPDQFTNGEFYYSLTMENKGETGNNAADMYLPGLTGEGELIQTVLYKEDGTKQFVTELPEVLHAGERIERFYRITDQISEQLAQYPNYEDFVFYFRNMWVEKLTSYGVPLKVDEVPAAELMALYEQYRALPAENVTVKASGTVEYGYAEGDVKLTASATAAANADYTLTYEWYDTNYDNLGEGQEFSVPAGLIPGEHHYHCVVVATRTDNRNQAQTQYQDVILKVEPKTVTLRWSGNAERVYDGTASNVTAVAEGLVGSDICTVTVTGNDAVDAGPHTATAERLSNELYRLPEEKTCEYVITAKEVTLTWMGSLERVYDGKPSDVAAEVSEESLADGDTCTVTVTGGDAKDAGTHTATATELSNGNYKLPTAVEPVGYALARAAESDSAAAELPAGDAESDGADTELPAAASTVTCEYVITPKEAVLEWSGAQTRVYDGTVSAVTAAVTNLVEGDVCAVTVTGGNAKDVGTYTATATALDNGNYKLPADVDCPYEITPKVAELSWTGADSRTYDGEASAVKAEVANLVEGDICAVTVTGGEEKNAGTYTATAETLDNKNYTLPTEKTREYVIEQKEVTLQWSGAEKRVYDGKASSVTAAVTNLVEGDTCAVTVAGGEEKNAGTYTATATALDNDNYKLPAEKTCEYVIGPKQISLIWSGTEERSYNGTASSVTAVAEGLIEGDTCTVTVTDGNAKDAGTHTARAALGNGNYALPQDPTCTYKITPLEAQLEWIGAQTKEYDGAAFNKRAQVKNLITGDACTVTVTDGDAKGVGEHTATATALDNPNYLLPTDAAALSQTYEITPRTAQLRWLEAGDREYDGKTSKVQAEVANLAAGDTCAVTVTGGDAKNAGTYTATATALANTNYVLPQETTCSYTINPKPVALVWSGTDPRVYDGTASKVTAAATGIADGDTCTVTVTGGDAKEAGTYTATAAVSASANYVLPQETTCSYTINPKPVTLVWSGTDPRVYDGTASKVTASATGIVDGDPCTVTVTGGDAKEAGTHTATAAVSVSANYVLPQETTCSYTINQKPVTLTWSGTEPRVYDGTASKVTATAAGMAAGDTCTVTVTGADAVNAGTHTATATVLSNANYVLPANASASYTISKAAQALSATETVQTVAAGNSLQLAPIVSGSGALSYTGSNPKIAAVGATGIVKGKKAGRLTVTVKAAGDDNHEQAVLKLTVIVVPKRSAARKVTSPAKRRVKVTWKKVAGASGYQIQVSTSKKFTKSKTKRTTAGSRATSKTIRKLKSGKTYYVRIRAYKKINGKKYYGRFSKVRRIRVQ